MFQVNMAEWAGHMQHNLVIHKQADGYGEVICMNCARIIDVFPMREGLCPVTDKGKAYNKNEITNALLPLVMDTVNTEASPFSVEITDPTDKFYGHCGYLGILGERDATFIASKLQFSVVITVTDEQGESMPVGGGYYDVTQFAFTNDQYTPEELKGLMWNSIPVNVPVFNQPKR